MLIEIGSGGNENSQLVIFMRIPLLSISLLVIPQGHSSDLTDLYLRAR